MERDGLLHRKVLPTTPPGVVYSLTDLGRSLCVPTDALAQWAFRHLPEIETAQKKFDLGTLAAAKRP
jgi:DNA-binding HxlR family transcriptional regulator